MSPAAAQAERVNSTVSVQVLRAASFAIDDSDEPEDDDHEHHQRGHTGHTGRMGNINLRADMDDTAASIITSDGVRATRLLTQMSRARPVRLGYDRDATAPLYVQIMY